MWWRFALRHWVVRVSPATKQHSIIPTYWNWPSTTTNHQRKLFFVLRFVVCTILVPFLVVEHLWLCVKALLIRIFSSLYMVSIKMVQSQYQEVRKIIVNAKTLISSTLHWTTMICRKSLRSIAICASLNTCQMSTMNIIRSTLNFKDASSTETAPVIECGVQFADLVLWRIHVD